MSAANLFISLKKDSIFQPNSVQPSFLDTDKNLTPHFQCFLASCQFCCLLLAVVLSFSRPVQALCTTASHSVVSVCSAGGWALRSPASAASATSWRRACMQIQTTGGRSTSTCRPYSRSSMWELIENRKMRFSLIPSAGATSLTASLLCSTGHDGGNSQEQGTRSHSKVECVIFEEETETSSGCPRAFQVHLYSEPDFQGRLVTLEDGAAALDHDFTPRSCKVLAGR